MAMHSKEPSGKVYPGKKLVINMSRFAQDDVINIVRGAFKQVGCVRQAGGWMIKIHTARTESRAKVTRHMRCGFERLEKPFWRFELYIPKAAVNDVAEINALAGKIVAALFEAAGFDPIPWWQHKTDWAESMPLGLKEEAPRLTMAQRVEKREAHCRNMLERAQRDAARALARVKRWQKRVDYYDRKERK